jgi:hypothetical protein
VFAGAVLLAVTFLVARRDPANEGAPSPPGTVVTSDPPQTSLPSADQFRSACSFASHRAGTLSFAVIETSGRLRCYRCNRSYFSASVVKAMLLVSYLEKIVARDLPLTRSHRASLEAMIRRSDNASADVIYDHVGDAALNRLATQADMTKFDVNGDWTSARITAADQVRFFARIPALTPARYRDYAEQLLASVVHSQTWGIPEIARPQWTTMFKGGWRHTFRGHLVHQVARLEKGDLSVAIAVLTDGNPSDAYGRATIRGIAARLLGTQGVHPFAIPSARDAG